MGNRGSEMPFLALYGNGLKNLDNKNDGNCFIIGFGRFV
jgi:hypothetical protein